MEDANVAVRRLVRAAFGLGENDVRPADQTAPAGRQSTPFVTVKIISAEDDGMASRSYEEDGDDILEASMVPERIVASIQFWGATSRPARLRGGDVSADVADYTGITAGAFSIVIDGASRAVSAINLSAATTMEEAAAALEARFAAALAGVTVTWTGKRFLVESPTPGQVSAIAPAGVTTAATLLGLTAAAGAVGSDNKSGIAKPSLEAFERARRLPRLLGLSANIELMQTLGLGFESASPARDLSAIADAAWESRGSVDLTFTVISREAVAVAAVEIVPAGLLVQTPDGVIHTTEIEVTP